MMAVAPELGEDFAQGVGRGQQMRQRALHEQAQRFKMGQMQRAAQREQATEQALGAAGGDMQKALPSLMKIDPKLGMAISKELRSARTDQLNQAKLAMEQNLQNMEVQGRILSGIKDEQSYQNALVELDKLGIDISPLPNQFNAEAIQFYAKRGMSLKEQGEAAHRAIMEALSERGVKVQEANALRDAEAHTATLPGKIAESKIKSGEAEFVSKDPQKLTPGQRSQLDQSKADAAARKTEQDRAFEQRERFETRRAFDAAESRRVQMRGQDKTDTRARELNQITRENKPPTAAEGRAAGFYHRALAATADADVLEEKISKKGTFAQVYQRYAPNLIQSKENQQYEQALRTFAEAVLRKDSGAVIKDSELDEARKRYFPVPGDEKAVLEQKRRARERVLEALKNEGGRAVSNLPPIDNLAPAAPLTPDGGKPRIDLRQFEGR